MLALIRLYQYLLRPLLGERCRFFPSCSDYAGQVLVLHGPWKGTLRALSRVFRCHPFNRGGHDPA